MRDKDTAGAMVPILPADVRFVGTSLITLTLIGAFNIGAASCKADLPSQVDSDAGVVMPCSIYADQLVSFNPAGGEGGSELGAKALGPPDSETVALTANGTLGVAFIGLGVVIDKTGDDLLFHGTMEAGSQIAVYVTFEGGELVFSGYLSPDSMTIDIDTASAPTFSFLQLVGISGDTQIDAVEATQMSCP